MAEAAYKQQSTDNIAVVLLQFEPWNANNKLHSQPSPRAQEGAPNQPSAELGTEVDLVSGGGKDLLNQASGRACLYALSVDLACIYVVEVAVCV